MKILHIITRMILGGAQENTMLTVLGQMEKKGCEVILLTGPTTGPEGTLVPILHDRGVHVIEEPDLIRPLAPLADYKCYRALRRRIRELKPDVVHTHSSKAGIIGRLAAWHEGVPLVVHTIHGLPYHPYQGKLKNAIYICAEKIAAKRCHKIACVAEAMSTQALAAGVGRPKQYLTVYSGMETESFLRRDRDMGALREKYKLGKDDFVISQVARLFELKGHEYLFEAFKEVVSKYPQARLFLIGDGTWRGKFERQVEEMGIAERVTFAGLVPREEVAEAIAASDMIAHCSLREGLARVLPQALLSGKPTVSFDVDGAREVVIDGETGWLVPPRNSAGVARAICEAIEDRDEALERAQRGCELCRQRFDWHYMADSLYELYETELRKNTTSGTQR